MLSRLPRRIVLQAFPGQHCMFKAGVLSGANGDGAAVFSAERAVSDALGTVQSSSPSCEFGKPPPWRYIRITAWMA